MGDRVAVLRDGRLQQVDSPRRLYARPANLFVAQFIGSPAMNVLTGRLHGASFTTEDGTRMQIGPRGMGDRPALLGIRPEHFRLDPEGLPADVITVEPTGSETHVHLRFASKEIVGVFRERIEARPGEELRLSPDPAQLHLFDAGSGRRLAA